MKGLRKVVEMDTSPGVFTDSKGELFDLRPQELCPSLANLNKKETSELRELAIKAIQAQIAEIESEEVPMYEEKFDRNLVEELKRLLASSK